MSEYIFELDNLKLVYEPMQREEIVRCKDCRHRFGCVHLIEVQQEDGDGDMIRCETSPDGHCWWGERAAFVTCKCGEELEAFGRVQTCPSCGRRLMA